MLVLLERDLPVSQRGPFRCTADEWPPWSPHLCCLKRRVGMSNMVIGLAPVPDTDESAREAPLHQDFSLAEWPVHFKTNIPEW